MYKAESDGGPPINLALNKNSRYSSISGNLSKNQRATTFASGHRTTFEFSSPPLNLYYVCVFDNGVVFASAIRKESLNSNLFYQNSSSEFLSMYADYNSLVIPDKSEKNQRFLVLKPVRSSAHHN
jgi:hypothetical protein